MNTQIQSFHFENQSVRVVLDDSHTPMFVAKDVAITLGYARPNDAIKQHCKGAVKHRTLETNGGNQKMRVIYEPDVYRLIFGSKLESAVKFQDWVFEEVLPTIRKTGQYTTPQKSTKDERTPLRQAVCALVGKTNLAYDEAYRMVHQYMGVNHIDEIALGDLPKAIAHVHQLTISGGTPIDQDAEYNALWRTIGLLEYERISKERRKLQQLLNDTLKQFQTIHASEGLLYDAIAEQRINTSTATTSPQERLEKAQAFINRQLAMKGR